MRGRSLLYLDASAIVKLVIEEIESRALREATGERTRISSALALTEVPRAVARTAVRRPRAEGQRLISQAHATVNRLSLIEPTRQILREAGAIGPWRLRSLDAVHLASARSLGGQLDAFVSYDRRQLEAAAGAGLTVLSPGASPPQ